MKFVTKIDNTRDYLVFEKPAPDVMTRLNELVEKCVEKTNGYVSITIERPYKQRSLPQNSKFYALITEIANATGNDIEDVKDGIKERAIKRGYPYRVNKISNSIKPYSTTEIDTIQMSYLIDECLQVCAELGIRTE